MHRAALHAEKNALQPTIGNLLYGICLLIALTSARLDALGAWSSMVMIRGLGPRVLLARQPRSPGFKSQRPHQLLLPVLHSEEFHFDILCLSQRIVGRQKNPFLSLRER